MIPPNMKRALDLYAQQGVPTGDCLRAILAGDLFAAFGRADPITTAAMPAIVAYIREHLPSPSFGSHAEVDGWIAAHARLLERPPFAAGLSVVEGRRRR